MKITLSLLIFLSVQTALPAQSSTDDAQRQLREDRARFSRDVERQRIEAQTREAQARASANDQRTREDLERLRTQQSSQTAETRVMKQKLDEHAAPLPSTAIRSSDIPLQSAAVVPDFSVTFLADGNCVLYIKGLPPEIKSPAETEKTLQRLLSARAKPAAAATNRAP